MLDYLVIANMTYSDLVDATMNFIPVKQILEEKELIPSKDRNKTNFPLPANELKRFLTWQVEKFLIQFNQQDRTNKSKQTKTTGENIIYE